MEPTLHTGDPILVEKWTMGARIYKKFDFSTPKLLSFRLPGLGRLKPGDIAVFNSPDGGEKGKIGFRINFVYAKRCIGTPGDTVRIVDGFYCNSAVPGTLLCPLEGQVRLSSTPDSVLTSESVYMQSLPGLPWTIRNFGPMLVPAKGSIVYLDSLTVIAYAQAIEYETGQRPEAGQTHTFLQDWFFFGGDNVLDSRDSRYFGLIPSDYVVGRVLPLGHRNRTAKGLCRKDRKLEATLAFAGINRGEIEKVLVHYENDERKTMAAEWLVKNMPYHYSYKPSAAVDSILSILTDIKTGKTVPEERKARWADFNYLSLPKVYDSHVITADFLIDNIDRAFEVYDKRPWNQYVTFEDFCEMLLPYRIGTGPLEPWREKYADRYSYILDSLYTGSDVVRAVDVINEELADSLFKYNVEFKVPSFSPDFLMNTRIGGCRESCEFTLYLLRSIGIPVSMDFSHKGYIHSWNVVLDTTGRREVFWFALDTGTRIRRGGTDGRTKGKAYREVFAPVKGRLYADVSEEYFGPTVCTVRLGEVSKEPIWLGMFTGGRWLPMETGDVKGKKVSFRNFEPEIVYAPTTRDGKERGYPFILHSDGCVEQFMPEMDYINSVDVMRKTRLPDRIIGFMDECTGGVIEGSLTADFLTVAWRDTLRHPTINYNWLYPQCKMHFLRFRPSEGRILQMGELRAFRDEERQDTIFLCVQTCSEAFEWGARVDNLVDGDELSFYQSIVPDAYVTVDLGATEDVAVVEWVPRNDDNFIRLGDEYELLYHDGPMGWRSLGVQTARDTVLHFGGIPGHALLRLHDRTRGKEEGAFLVKDGHQLFVSW